MDPCFNAAGSPLRKEHVKDCTCKDSQIKRIEQQSPPRGRTAGVIKRGRPNLNIKKGNSLPAGKKNYTRYFGTSQRESVE